jgi:hypothetical protein
MYRVGIYVYFVHFYLRTARVIRSDTRQQTLAHILMPCNPIFNRCKRQPAVQKQCILPFFNLSLSLKTHTIPSHSPTKYPIPPITTSVQLCHCIDNYHLIRKNWLWCSGFDSNPSIKNKGLSKTITPLDLTLITN